MSLAGTGTQTASLAMGGETPSVTGTTEKYDGTSWVSAPSMSTARFGSGGAGTQTAGLVFGGTPGSGVTAATEEFTGETSADNVKTITTS